MIAAPPLGRHCPVLPVTRSRRYASCHDHKGPHVWWEAGELLGHLWIALQIGLLAFVGGLILITVSNLRALPRLGDHGPPGRWPMVSVLVPARNEEANIGPCLRSLLAQDYPHFEALALDDSSEDGTGDAMARLAAENGRLRVLAGHPLPPGWLGKNWACRQLARAARGELLLFTDADTQHHPQALANAVAALEAQDADLLTVFPRQEAVSWGERLLVPGLTWGFVLFLPIGVAHRSPRPALSVAAGQFMLFRRRAYGQIGGHAAVRKEVLEDLTLGRLVKERGLRWRVADGCGRVQCRMYHSLREAFAGFGKNLFGSFRYHLPGLVLVALLAGVLALGPIATLTLWLAGAPIADLAVGLAASLVAAPLILTGILYTRFQFPAYLALLYPVSLVLGIGLALYSLLWTMIGQASWKGRQLDRPKVRWW